jgi:broad specificity phosphatase PhoE
MAARLLVVAHGRAGSTTDPVFGDLGPLLTEASPPPIEGRVQHWVAGPERACRETVQLLGGQARIEPALQGPELGSWTGRTVSEIAAEDPEGLRSWLSDPRAAPHGGESLAAALGRIGLACDRRDWPDGTSVVVVTPAAARLLAVHALGGPANLSFRLDVAAGSRFRVSRHSRSWRLLLG